MRRARTERPENFEVDLSHPLMRGAVLLGLGQAHHSIRYRDESQYGNHGVLTNMAPVARWVWSTKLGRRILGFDGINDRVMLPQSGTLLTNSPNYTVAFWSTLPMPLSGAWFSWDKATSWRCTFAYNGASVFWRTRTAGGGNTNDVTVTTLPASGLAHVALVYRGTTKTAFVNGISETPQTSVVGPTGFSDADFIAIGASGDFSGSTCSIGDWCFWQRALSAAEIMRLADPSNVMMSGAIREPGLRRSFVGQVGGGAKPWLYAHRRSGQLIGASI